MTSEEEEEVTYCRTIDTLIRQNRIFATWRIPGESPRFVMQSTGSARLFYNISELDGQTGFVIAPFHATCKQPIVLIEPDCFDMPRLNPATPRASGPLAEEVEMASSCLKAKEDYARCFSLFISALREGTFDKLVLSRHQSIARPHSFSPATAFRQACELYSRSYIYLCHTPQTGTWLGSTPEVILSGEQGAWSTVALAGTQPLQHGELPTSWDNKNRHEQALVADYIRHQLAALGVTPQETPPHAVHAGALSHLRSDFSFILPNQRRLGDLLQRLHPTPAVCGLPKEETYRFILRNEGYERRYYSGFIGWLSPHKRSDLYVNLRCMHIAERLLTLYAGGGLLPSSRMEDEWLETEAKMQTMQRLIASHSFSF